MMLGLVMTFSACAKKDYLITIKTTYGEIKVILYDQTPGHKDNFLKLAQNGDFDSTDFHRIIKDFMIQGGDVNAKKGNENKEKYTIPAEFVETLIHQRGALAAAREGDKENPTKASSGCQWYIVQGMVYSEDELTTDMQKLNTYMVRWVQKPENAQQKEELSRVYFQEGQQAYSKKLMELKPTLEKEFNTTFEIDFPEDRLKVYTTIGGAPHLDGAYTVFGRVVEGMGVVDKIASVKTGAMDSPVEKIYMTMEVAAVNEKKLEQLYGIK